MAAWASTVARPPGRPFGVAAVAPQRLRRFAVQQVAAQQFGRGDVAVTEGDRGSGKQAGVPAAQRPVQVGVGDPPRGTWTEGFLGQGARVPYQVPARRRACSKGGASKAMQG